MKHLTREQLLAAKPRMESVKVEQLGGEILVRGMTALEREQYEYAVLLNGDKDEKVRARFVSVFSFRKNGKEGNPERMFTDADVDELAEVAYLVLDQIYAKILDLSGLSAEAFSHLKKRSKAATRSDSSGG